MVINDYVGWPSGVNKIILDSSTIKSGENALRRDSLEGGMKRGYARGTFVPDIYSISMEFDWVNKDKNGDNEYQKFLRWYKYVHKYGSVPFEFPQILYSPETGIRIVDENSENYRVEYYRIVSSIPGKKSGEKVSVNMTWESHFSGVIQIEEQPEEISRIDSADKTSCVVVFAVEGNTQPTSNDFVIYVDGNVVPLVGFSYSDYVARMYYKPLPPGNHTLTFSYKDIYKKEDFIQEFDVK